ncbi:hypothetical protein T261_7776 [Streptomyces lydicus]|nr:hypothetical protein T261_7776 [Streptomyces lydicus]
MPSWTTGYGSDRTGLALWSTVVLSAVQLVSYVSTRTLCGRHSRRRGDRRCRTVRGNGDLPAHSRTGQTG